MVVQSRTNSSQPCTRVTSRRADYALLFCAGGWLFETVIRTFPRTSQPLYLRCGLRIVNVHLEHGFPLLPPRSQGWVGAAALNVR